MERNGLSKCYFCQAGRRQEILFRTDLSSKGLLCIAPVFDGGSSIPPVISAVRFLCVDCPIGGIVIFAYGIP